MLDGLKPLLTSVLMPLIRPLARLGVRPNHLTLAGVAIFGLAGWMASRGEWKWGAAVMISGALLDSLDGILARETNAKSVFGAILDSTCDRITEIFLLLGVLVYYMTAPILNFSTDAVSLRERAWGIALCYAAMAMSLMISYVKARCEGAGVTCKGGMLQRPERVILFGLGLLLGPRYMIWILAGITVLGAGTVVQRIIIAWRGAAGKEKQV